MNKKNEYLINGKYSFLDVVNIPHLQKIFKRFSDCTGFTTCLVSYPDQTLLIATGWRDICTKFHRSYPNSEKNCKESNFELPAQLNKQKEINIRTCASGLVDGATPIIVKGSHVANLFTGQILFKKPDIDFFTKQSQKYGYDTKAYLKALSDVPVISEKEFKKKLQFLKEVAIMLAEQGLINMENLELAKRAKENENELRTTLNSIGEAVIAADTQGKITHMNPVAEILTGWKHNEALGKQLTKIFKTLKNRTKTHSPNTEATLISRKGHQFQIAYSISPIQNKKRETTGTVLVFRDISEAHKIKKELQQSEEKYRALVESSSDWIWEVDKNGHYTYSSPQVKKLLGYSPKEILGKTPFDLMPPEEAKQIASEFKKLITSGKQIINLENKCIHKNGSIITLETSGVPIYDAAKNIVGYQGIDRDITKRKKSEEALKNSELKHRTLFEKANDAIILSEGKKFLECNPKTVQLFGYKSKKEILGRSPIDFSPLKQPDGSNSKQKAMNYINAALKGTPQNFYWQHTKKNGNLIDVEVSLNRLLIGEKKYLQAVCRDVTKNKKIEKELLNSEVRFQQILNNSPSAIYLKDKEGKYLIVNKEFKKLFSNKNKKVINKTDYDLFPKTIASLIQNNDKKVITTGRPITVVEEAINNEKQRSYISVKFPLKDSQNKIIGTGGVSINITEWEQTKKELQKSEERLRLLTNNLSSVMLYQMTAHIDGTRKFTYVSDNIFQINGVKREEVMKDASKIYKRILPEHLPTLIEAEKIALKGMSTFNHEVELYASNNEIRWFQFISTPRKQPDGTVIWDGVQIDITKRKKADEELINAHKQLRNIFDHSFEISIISTDATGLITAFNVGAERMLGYTAEEMINKKTPLAFHLKSEVSARGKELSKKYGYTIKGFEVFATKVRHGKYEEREWTYVKKDGSHITVNLVVNAIRNDKGEITGLFGFAHDITARKQAEQELNNLRNYLSNIIDSMPSLLIGIDANGIVTQWNKTAEQSSGITASHAQGKNITELLPEIAEEINSITENIRTKKIINSQKRFRLSEGNSRHKDITVYPLIKEGAEGAVIRIDDVTEQVRLEEMMIQNEKMVSVGGLAAGMAHEINNPLAGMIQTANVIALRLDEKIEMAANKKAAAKAGTTLEAIHKFMLERNIPNMVREIKKSGQRLATIVKNMLNFARKTDSDIKMHNIADLIDKTVELARTDYDNKKKYDFKQINIIKKYTDKTPLVPCESQKIQQVILNILRNGAQAMQDGHTSNPQFIIHTDFTKEEQMVNIVIEDNGPGIKEEVRKRIFEPFYTTKPVGIGTGLGLSISYFIVTENHNGKMSVESQPGKGTKFIIRLPYNRGIKHNNETKK